jgi:MFS family permease
MNAKTNAKDNVGFSESKKKAIFWASFVALMATSFAFMVRAMLISEWSHEFNLTKTQMGEIMGVGLWPFALSIVLLSLIVDRIGYRSAMIIAFVCHVASTVILIFSNDYHSLYWGTFILALGNGTVEGTINPLVASMYPKEKAKMLTILHAGWPGGMILGGILGIIIGEGSNWQLKVGLTLLPIIAYGIMMIPKKFPVHERVLAGVSFKDMLKEVGAVGSLIISAVLVFQIGSFFSAPLWLNIVIIAVISIGYFTYTRSLGQPLFIFLLLIMFPLATTELGTDSWIIDLMSKEMHSIGLQAAWILIYAQVIMLIFRFISGSLLRIFNPVGLLILCSAIAAIGLYSLSFATTTLAIFLLATFYSFGKSYFYPVMLGIAGEQFPKGGALTVNVTLGVGLLAVGVVGNVFLGYIQDKAIDEQVKAYDSAHGTVLYEKYITESKESIFGVYKSLDYQKLDKGMDEEKVIISNVELAAKRNALRSVSILPLIMLLFYTVLYIYFKRQGGYKPKELKN